MSAPVCYQKLKQLFIEKVDIETLKFNNKGNNLTNQFDQFLQVNVRPYIQAFQALEIIKQIVQPLKKRKSSEPKQLLAKLTTITHCKQYEQNIRYFYEKQNEISKTNVYFGQLIHDQIDKSLSFDKKVRQIVYALNLQKSFLVYVSTEPENHEITKQYKQMHTKYKNLMKNYKYESIIDVQIQAVLKYKTEALDFRTLIQQCEKNNKQLLNLETYSQKAKIISENMRQIKNQQSKMQTFLKRVIQSLKNTKNVPDSYAISIKLQNKSLQNQFLQLLSSVRMVIQQKKQEIVPNRGLVYSPFQGIIYADLTKYINSLYSQIYEGIQQKLKIKMQRIQEFCISQRDYIPQQNLQQKKLQQSINDFILKLYKILRQKRKSKQNNILIQEIQFIDRQLEQHFKEQSSIKLQIQELQHQKQKLDNSIVQLKNIIVKLQNILNSVLSFDRQQQRRNKTTQNYQQKIKNYQKESLILIDLLKQRAISQENEANLKNQTTQIQYLVQTQPNKELPLIEYQKKYAEAISQIQQLQQKVKDLHQKLENQKKTISKFEKQNRTLSNKLKQSSEKLLFSDRNRQQLAQRLGEMENNFEINMHQKQQAIRDLQLLLQSKQNSSEFQLIKNEKIELQIKIQQLQYSYNQLKQQSINRHQELRTCKIIHDQEIKQLNLKAQMKKLQFQNQMEFLQKALIEQKKAEILEIQQKNQHSIAYFRAQSDKQTKQIQKLKQQLHVQIGHKLCELTIEKTQEHEDQQKKRQKGQYNSHQKQQENKNVNKVDPNKLVQLEKQYKLKFQDQIQKLKQQIQRLKRDIKSLRQQNQSLMQKIYEKNIDNQTQLKQNQNLQEQLIKLNQENTTLQSQLEMLRENNKVVEKSFVRHCNFLNQLEEADREEERNEEALPKLLIPYTKALFNEDIFLNDQISKEKLISHLQEYSKKRITRTALLYKYDTRNKTNFHQYIDQIKGLAIVVKTKKAIISGFYPDVHREKQVLDKGGLLVSVTNDQSYRLFTKKPGEQSKTIYRGMIYDTYFAIFGNAQIRVKTGFKTVFSNFGVSNSYFDSRGDRIDKFLNEGQKREMQFEFCEFYQIIFSQN